MVDSYSEQMNSFQEGLDQYQIDQVTRSERFWVEHQRWLESCGYMLRPRYSPDWVPSWRETKKWRHTCEDGQRKMHARVMDATRLDGSTVALKIIRKSEHTDEVDLMEFFASNTLASEPGNHCVPLIEILEVPENEDTLLVVMPFLRPYDNPRFKTIGEAVDFFAQVFEGVQFMHKHHIAHRDCCGKNIMMDATLLYPKGYHPIQKDKNRNFRGRAKHYTRTERPPRYFLGGFDLSRRYNPRDGPPLDMPIYGHDETVPEFRGQGYQTPSDPFATDIYCLGKMIRENFLDAHFGFDFMSALIGDMIQDDPSKRPTINQVVSRFAPIYRALGGSRLRSRLVRREEGGALRWRRSSAHFLRQRRFALQGIQPVPRPRRTALFKQTQKFLDAAGEQLWDNRALMSPEEGKRLLQDYRELRQHGTYDIEETVNLERTPPIIPDAQTYKEKAIAHYIEVKEYCDMLKLEEAERVIAERLASSESNRRSQGYEPVGNYPATHSGTQHENSYKQFPGPSPTGRRISLQHQRNGSVPTFTRRPQAALQTISEQPFTPSVNAARTPENRYRRGIVLDQGLQALRV